MNGISAGPERLIRKLLKKKWRDWSGCSPPCLGEVISIEKIKCSRCGQTLLLAEYVKGEIKCPRCKAINKLDLKKDRAQSHTREE